MEVIKLREAKKRTYNCHKCNGLIEIGHKYYDSKTKAQPPKPFPTAKYCLGCAEAMLKSSEAMLELKSNVTVVKKEDENVIKTVDDV